MAARSAFEPMMTSQVIENRLRIDSEYSKQMDPADLSCFNELLDSIAALGIAMDYDQIGLKPDRRENKSSPITHQIAVVEEQSNNNSSPILKASYIRISELIKLDTRLRGDTPGLPNLESDVEPKESLDILDPELINLEVLQTPESTLGQGSDLTFGDRCRN